MRMLQGVAALGLAAAVTAMSPAVETDRVVRAEGVEQACFWYWNWQNSGGTIVCYNPGGTGCAVCPK